MSGELKIAIEAARKGAGAALKYFGKKINIEIKPNNTPVTIADREAEEAIKQYILSKLPNAEFVGEESGGDLSKSDFWIIDPIDGTKNYTRGLLLWSVLIAHYKQGKITVGVSNTPLMNEMIYAELGNGAFLNGEKISVSKTKTIKSSFLSYGDISTLDLNAISNLSHMCLSSRGIGDAYSYHLLANGRIDIMIEKENSAWDVAPFKLIIEEAGGKFSTIEGEEWEVTDRSCIATNGLLHDQVIKIYNN